jgi:hypothetical protein
MTLRSLHRSAKSKLRRILFCYDTEPVEVFLGATAILLGLLLLNPWTDTFASTSVYDTLSAVAPEYIWGASLLMLGWARLYAVLLNLHSLRQTVAFCGFLLWLFVTIAFAHANPAATAVPVYGMFSLASAWVYIRQGHRR